MKTITLQIGNSDDKLTQCEWSLFVGTVENDIRKRRANWHFSGLSRGDASWQNACWVLEMEPEEIELLKVDLTATRQAYNQDSVAITEGQTAFV